MKNSEIRKIGGWEVHPDRVLLKTPIVTVNAGPVVCRRNGRKKEFYLLDFPDWVNVVALTPKREIVLIRQFRYGSGRLEIEIPGGMVNPGEPPVDAGCRELLEETGYVGKNPRIIGRVCPNPAIQRNSCHTLLVEDAVKVAEPCPDEMEDIELLLRSEQEVRRLISSAQIDHGLVLNALSFYLGLNF